MHAVMLLRISQGDDAGALQAASEAAPYVHSRLNATDLRVHSTTDRTDDQITAEIAALRTKFDAARSLPAPAPVIDLVSEPAEPIEVTAAPAPNSTLVG
jgi:hypothetical protein